MAEQNGGERKGGARVKHKNPRSKNYLLSLAPLSDEQRAANFASAIAQVTDAVEVRCEPNRGVYIVAKRPLPENYRVLACRPLALSPDVDEAKHICDCCFVHSESSLLVSCKGCLSVFWCSNTCETIGTSTQHSPIECRAFNHIRTKKNASKDVKMRARQVLRFLAMGLCERNTQTVVGETRSAEDLAGSVSAMQLQDKHPTTPTKDTHHTTPRPPTVTYTDTPLQPHNTTPISMGPGCFSDVALLCNNRSSFGAPLMEVLKVAADLAVEALPGSCGPDMVLDLLAAINCNQFGIYNAEGLYVAKAVYLHLSGFNHSCQPTLYTQQELPNMAVCTRRPIEKGEELTISYVDVSESIEPEERRGLLKLHYHFDCRCPVCASQMTG